MELINETLKKQVEERIYNVLSGGSTPPSGTDFNPFETMYFYHMGFCDEQGKTTKLASGKYMRPALTLMMCSGLGGDPQQAIPAAASIELLHRTSLIFDDIQDNGQERNGRPSVHAVWGSSQAINAGLALSCLARLAVLGGDNPDKVDKVVNTKLGVDDNPQETDKVDKGDKVNILRVLEKATIDLTYGQYLDLKLQCRPKVNFEDYLQMIHKKTAALFGAACEVGAMVAMAPQPVIDLARQFGIALGTLFQMHDDYLGVWGVEGEVGKTANDLMERKRSLPVVLAMQAYPDEVITPMRTIVNLMSPEHVVLGYIPVYPPDRLTSDEARTIKRWMESKHIDRLCKEKETGMLTHTHRLLQELPITWGYKTGLTEFLDKVVNRSS